MSSSVNNESGQGPIEQGHKAHRIQHMPGEAVFFTDNQQQFLHIACTDGNHQTPARSQLIEQRLRHIGRRCGDDDAVRRLS